jgi:hypothetical protein
VLAYDDPLTGMVYIVINQAIHIVPHLSHHLLCSMQCRVNDVTVDETPTFLARDPTDHTHALTVNNPHNPAQTVILLLALQGVTLLLNVRAPTLDEWNSDTFTRLSLTSESLTWDPRPDMVVFNFADEMITVVVQRWKSCLSKDQNVPIDSCVRIMCQR